MKKPIINPTSSELKELIVKTAQSLLDEEVNHKWEDGNVLIRISDVLKEEFNNYMLGVKFWNAMIFASSARENALHYFDNDEEALDFVISVVEYSKRDGIAYMPAWGYKGT